MRLFLDKGGVFWGVAVSLCVMFSPVGAWADERLWLELDEGLHWGVFEPTKESTICPDRVRILRIDPDFFGFRLLCASEHGLKARTTKQWSREFGLVAAINASMYQGGDRLKSTGFMKNGDHMNNGYINRNFGAFMAFDPRDPAWPPVRFIDRYLEPNWKEITAGYRTVVQNYRMISEGEQRGWPQQRRIWGTAAVGMDKEGRVLFILSPAAYATSDFIQIMLSLPVGIRSAMYVEGGPEASLYAETREITVRVTGSCRGEETNRDKTEFGYPIPNVLGIVRKPRTPSPTPRAR